MKLTDGVKSIDFRTRRTLFFGIKYHALQELNMSCPITSYHQPSFAPHVLIRKMLTLGIVSRRLFKGIFNGFQSEIEIPSDYFGNAPWFIQEDGTFPHVLRSVGRSGIRLHEYRPILEYSIRRNQVSNELVIVSAQVMPTNSEPQKFIMKISELERKTTVHQVVEFVKVLPRWHGLCTHFSLLLNDPECLNSKNVFYPEFPLIKADGAQTKVKYSQQSLGVTTTPRDSILGPILFFAQISNSTLLNGCNITKGNRLILTDTSENLTQKKTAMWPALNWSVSESDLIAIPPYSSEVSTVDEGWHLPSNTNWAHFLEDVAPRTLLMGADERLKLPLLSHFEDPVQVELLERLGVLNFQDVNDQSNIRINSLIFFIHLNQRSKIIHGLTETDNLSVDVELMNLLRNRISEAFDLHFQKNEKVFVVREKKLLRKLINQTEVINFLKSINYKVVSMENLSLTERVYLLSSCNSLIYESGAAGTNGFFTKDGTEILELRHPANVSSQEHKGMVETIRADWKVVVGRKASFINRVLHGSDSWVLRVDDLKKSLNGDSI